MPYLYITEIVLVHCNIVNNNYQQYSRALHTIISNKSFGTNFFLYFKKKLNSEISYIEVCFTDQNSKPLETEDEKKKKKKKKITLVSN